MNPKQLEWLAMERCADLRRAAAVDRFRVAARSSEPVRPGLVTRLASWGPLRKAAVRTVLAAVHLVRPRGRAVS